MSNLPMNEYLKLDLDFQLLFFISLQTEWNLSTIVLGQEKKRFLYWTRNKRSLHWHVHPSFIIVVAFCSVSLTCPPVNELILLKNSSKQIYEVQQTYFFLAHFGPYWNAMWFLLNLLPISDWLLYQQGQLCFFVGSKSVLFSCYFFGINSPNFWVTN